MSTTRNIEASALFAMPFIGYQPVNISNGEPAITAANLTKQAMLGPPFRWPWNRADFQLALSTDTATWGQDYMLNLPDFHFSEKVWIADPTSTAQKVTEIEIISGCLSMESVIKRPSSASMMLQDDNGIVTLRLNTLPDKPYVLNGFYQKATYLMDSLACLWSPIPDHLSYIYDWGFLGFCALLTKDARAPIFLGKFASHLLGSQDGLTAQQRNIFLGNFLDLGNQQAREQMATQQGAQGRANT
jgi:hypothetical protein